MVVLDAGAGGVGDGGGSAVCKASTLKLCVSPKAGEKLKCLRVHI